MNPENEPIFELMTDADLRNWDKVRCYKCNEIVNKAEAKQDDFGDLMCGECFSEFGSRLCIWCGDECSEESCESCKIFDYQFDDIEFGIGLQII